MYITLGNHDTYYKNTNDINSIQELLSQYDQFTVIDKPTQLKFDELSIDVVPWITNENLESTVNYIEQSDSVMLCGHLEIIGFQVMSGVKHLHGLTPKMFNKFEMVLSGHFHIKQSEANIYYLGSQYQMNFGDVSSKKGFHILDTKTRDLEFIQNPNNIFHVFNYSDATEDDVKDIAKFISKTDFRSSFVRIFIREKTKQSIFDKLIDALWSKGIYDLSIVDEMNLITNNSVVDFSENEDTLTIISKEIDGIERDFNKGKLKNIIKDVYMESLRV
jgi:DNA repair exonuclease SbcCD nuclease subunit